MSAPSDIALVRSPVFLKHIPPGAHPENPARLEPVLDLIGRDPRFRAIPEILPVSADEAVLKWVHSPEMVATLLDAVGKSGWFDADTYYSKDSIEVGQLAAGATMSLAQEIWRGRYRRGFSLVRPPGHHSTPQRAMGFGLFNNVALAAASILRESPKARLAIVDFDVHHGNGIQDIFYENPQVLYLSTHRFPFYPGTGALTEVGKGKGRGTTVNFPLDAPYSDFFFIALYQDLLLPALKSFAPEMIFVSAGFDGHILDPMQGLRLTSSTYSWLAEALIATAEQKEGKILFCLEGGYHPEAMRESIGLVLTKMLDLPRLPFALNRQSFDWQPLHEEFRAFHRQFFPELA